MDYDANLRTITTNRLQLRLFQQADAQEVQRLCHNKQLYQNTLHLPFPYKLKDAKEWIKHHKENFQKGRLFEMAVTDKENGCLYGAIALSYKSHANNGELAYWIGEEYWGNGYATEAGEAILEFAFQVKLYHRVYALSFDTNPGSKRVLEKIGMKQEGVLREHVKKDEQYKDLVYFGMLKGSKS
ncbi:acetyltransferase [Pontibacillus chungwhensis BH030062]|uniref:Acetyltransferase n=1 Tax=Pontibacillus chungwhensis BH030062 TaxID=1385513 RepID=A0A0A2UZ26_9BACI|nr:GNAT family N-acetyltransferase [Pontibacillus chungwhensis]KGP91776.1 acetyltransferase [Pontibacillus chungwhensis BH030062]